MSADDLEAGALEVIIGGDGHATETAIIYDNNGEFRARIATGDIYRISPNFAQGQFTQATFFYIAGDTSYTIVSINRVPPTDDSENNGDNGGGLT